MKKASNIITIIALILIVVLIGGVSYGYYKKATMEVKNPIVTKEVQDFGTLKLELYWMGICKTAKEYMELSNSMIGNDHISKKVYQEKHTTNYDFINEYIDKLFDIDSLKD